MSQLNQLNVGADEPVWVQNAVCARLLRGCGLLENDRAPVWAVFVAESYVAVAWSEAEPPAFADVASKVRDEEKLKAAVCAAGRSQAGGRVVWDIIQQFSG